MIAVSGRDCNNLKELFNQLGNSSNWKDCIENLPNINWPGGNRPEGNLPQIPGGGIPDMEIPAFRNRPPGAIILRTALRNRSWPWSTRRGPRQV